MCVSVSVTQTMHTLREECCLIWLIKNEHIKFKYANLLSLESDALTKVRYKENTLQTVTLSFLIVQ